MTQASILSGLLEDFPEQKLDEALTQLLGAARYALLLDGLEERIRERTRIVEAENRQIFQAEKLASVGRLSAGVAHEINNPIGYVHSNLATSLAYLKKFAALGERVRAGQPADQLWRELDMDFVLEDFDSLMQESLAGIDRVARIVADLKGFSNIDHGEEEMADLNDSLRQACRTMTAKLPGNIRLDQDLKPLPRILCLPGYLHQVFLNLMENSAQSLPGGGEIQVRSQLLGKEICISISDNGHGIPEHVMPRIFEPFFTTRDVGQGTGLGLTVARDIVQVHGGRIEVESREGTGTTMTIYLPVG